MLKPELSEIRLADRQKVIAQARKIVAQRPTSSATAQALDEAFAAFTPAQRVDGQHSAQTAEWDAESAAQSLAQQGQSLDQQCERLSNLLEALADEI